MKKIKLLPYLLIILSISLLAQEKKINSFNNQIQKDEEGNTYLSGYFENSVIKFGSFTLYNKGSRDIYIVKYDTSGKIIWAKNFGSASNDLLKNFVVEKNGNILLEISSNEKIYFAEKSPAAEKGNNKIYLSKNGLVSKIENQTSLSLNKSNASLRLTFPEGGEHFKIGTTKEISWESNLTSSSELKFEYSTNNGNSWFYIATIPSFFNTFKWTIPNTPSSECKLRFTDLSDTTNYDINPGLFVISGDLNWYKQNSGSYVQLNSLQFLNDKKGYAAGYDGIFSTNDGGKNWTQQLSGFGLLSINFTDENNGYASGLGGSVFKTTNGGLNWKQQYTGTHSSFTHIQFITPLKGWIAAGTEIYRTTNGGVNWTEFFVTDHILTSIHFIDEKKGWTAGGEGVIFNTTDGGITWNQQTANGTSISQLNSVFFIDENTGWSCGSGLDIDGGVILKTTDGGTEWDIASSGLKDFLNSITFLDKNTGWIMGNDGSVFNSTDGGNTWIEKGSGTNNNLTSVSFIDSENGWGAGDNGTIIKYSSNQINPSLWFNEISVSIPGTHLEKFVMLGQSDYATDNIDMIINESAAYEVSSFQFDARFILPSNEESFIDQRSSSESIIVWKLKIQSGYSDVPVSMNWNTAGFPEGSFILKDDSENILLDMKENNTFTTLPGETDYLVIEFTSGLVSVEDVPFKPANFSLEQNYPNPFNPSTKIKFSVPTVATGHATSVQLRVYDILGNEITSLINEEKTSGTYEIEFDGKDLSSGIYIYKLIVGNLSISKKMMLMK